MRWKINLVSLNGGKIVKDDLYYNTRAEMRSAAKFYKTMSSNVLAAYQYDMEKI